MVSIRKRILLGLLAGSVVGCAREEKLLGRMALQEGQTVWSVSTADGYLKPTTTLGGGISCSLKDKSGSCLELEVVRSQGDSSFSGAEWLLAAERWPGTLVEVVGEIRIAGSVDSTPWQGVVFGFRSDRGGPRPIRAVPPGSGKTWTRVEQAIELDSTTGKIRVRLGARASASSVSFRNVVVRIRKVERPRRSLIPTVNAKTRFRTVNAGNSVLGEGFDSLASWRVNGIRWVLGGGVSDSADSLAYEAWLERRLIPLDSAFATAAGKGIKIAVCLFQTPGGRIGGRTNRMFLEEGFSRQFLTTWEKIARRYKGNPALWGYDLVNEPVQERFVEGVPDWWQIQLEATRRIRAIDPEATIFLEVDAFDNPRQFRWLGPPPFGNVVYETHMYHPHDYTHQGVGGKNGGARGAAAIAYPGRHKGDSLGPRALKDYLVHVRNFQLAYGVPIFIGEFSAARWAPGAAQYLSDCIGVFEEYGWDWSYHSFRGASAWDLEVEDQPWNPKERKRAAAPTGRLRVIQSAMKRNPPLVPLVPGKSDSVRQRR